MERAVAEPAVEDFDNSLPLAAIRDEFIAKARWDVHAWIGRGEEKTDGYYGAPVFHMSGGACMREEILKKDGFAGGAQKAISVVEAEYGALVEAMMSAACQWKGISAERQTKMWRDWAYRAGHGERWDWTDRRPDEGPRRIFDDCLVIGSLDEIVVWDNLAYIIDWKSVNPRKFQYLDREVDESKHRQLASYQMTYIKQYAVKADDGRPGVLHNGVVVPLSENPRLVYIDRASSRMKQVGVNMATWGPLARGRWELLRATWERYKITGPSALPDPLPLHDGKVQWKCNYCRYALAVYPNTAEMFCPEQQKAIHGGNGKVGTNNVNSS